MKIAIVLPTLQGGGAEKTFITLGEFFKKKNYTIDIIIFKNLKDYPTSLNVIPILKPAERISRNFIKFFFRLYKILKNYDIVIGGLEGEANHIAIVLSKILKKRVISTFHNNIEKLYKTYKNRRLIFHILDHLLLRYSDINVCVSFEVLENVKKLYKIPNKKLACIYNPIDIEKVRSLSIEKVEKEYEEIFKKKVFVL
ncbi:MAG: glycosyltransferase [candidate division WOR-3 bacterium]|nr:glycosyltransferase [candidate division WOR-3 bacterium]